MAQRRTKRRSGRNQSPTRRLVLWALGLTAVLVCTLGALDAFPSLEIPDVLRDPDCTATVVTDVLNVRSGPSTDTEIIGAYTQGETVEVAGEPIEGFVPVQFGNRQGWMATEYLAFDGQTATLSNPVQVTDVAAADARVEVPAQPDEPDPGQTESVPAPVDPEEVVEEEPVVEPTVPPVPAERWIDIDRSTATLTLYEGDVSVASFGGKIGRDPAADGFYSTAIGTYHVYSMNKGLAPTPFADDTYLTDWVGFDPDRKNGIHSPVRDEFGNEKAWQNPATLGCVRLSAADAVTVFNFAELGMRVEVHD